MAELALQNDPTKDIYEPGNILVTGGAGFIASNLTLYLLKKYPDSKVVVVDNLSYNSNLKNLDDVADNKNFVFVQTDICHYQSMCDILKNHNISTIFHLAAETHVDRSYIFSFKFTQSNFVGTHVLLEAVRSIHPQITRFVHISTDEVYGTSGPMEPAKTETCQLTPTNPYAATKAAAEMMVTSYQISYGIPCIITRGSNVYGPRQFPDKLIPKFMILLMTDKRLCIHGDGSVLRSFIYVEDVASALDFVMCKGTLGEVYNLSDCYECTVMDVTKRLCGMFDKKVEDTVDYVRDRNYNDKRYFISNDKLLALGWKPAVNFKEGLKRTVQWYKDNKHYWDGETMKKALVPHPEFVGADANALEFLNITIPTTAVKEREGFNKRFDAPQVVEGTDAH